MTTRYRRYRLEVWHKATRRYVVHWEGRTLEQARSMACKRYNRRSWMGKARIIETTQRVIEP